MVKYQQNVPCSISFINFRKKFNLLNYLVVKFILKIFHIVENIQYYLCQKEGSFSKKRIKHIIVGSGENLTTQAGNKSELAQK